jgi:hypothetical protein
VLYEEWVAFNINQRMKISLSKVIDRFEWIVGNFGRNNTLLELEHIIQHKADIDIIIYYELFNEGLFVIWLPHLQGMNSKTPPKQG